MCLRVYKDYKFYNPLKIRMQIYDCERGVVKCFAVYFFLTPTLSKGEGVEKACEPI